jgi:hypothetical protein
MPIWADMSRGGVSVISKLPPLAELLEDVGTFSMIF